MLHLEGEKTYTLPPEQLFARLVDLQFLVKCLPDLHEVKGVEGRTARAVLRPGFSFARGEMQMAIEIVSETPPTSATFLLKGKGIGSASEVETTFNLSEGATGTALHWTADIKQLGGLLKAVPSGLIQGGAQRVIEQMLENVEKHLHA